VRRWLLLLSCGLGSCAAPAAPPSAVAPVPPARAPDESELEHGPADPWFTLATSVEGRPIRAAVLGHGARRVLWVGGIHGDEREGARATAELPAAFLAEPGASERVTLYVIEDLNPDGTARNTRGNAHGVDLNRNFPAESFRPGGRHGREPLSEPESRALGELVASWRPALVLLAHAWRGAEFVNHDGPARALAERFALESGFELRASDELEATPGSFGSWAGAALGLPVLTLEFRRGRSPESAWEATRAALLAVILGE
jgi:predicted deacylase